MKKWKVMTNREIVTVEADYYIKQVAGELEFYNRHYLESNSGNRPIATFVDWRWVVEGDAYCGNECVPSTIKVASPDDEQVGKMVLDVFGDVCMEAAHG